MSRLRSRKGWLTETLTDLEEAKETGPVETSRRRLLRTGDGAGEVTEEQSKRLQSDIHSSSKERHESKVLRPQVL